MQPVDQSTLIVMGDPLATLRQCEGYYDCPRDGNGQRLGPLVAYAGKDPHNRHFVGDIYLNCARLERLPVVLQHLAQELAPTISETFPNFDWIMGVPEGGRSLGLLLAIELGCQYIYPEKGQKPGEDQRPESVMVVGRHEIEPHTCGLIVEDVCNNFSSTHKVVGLVEQQNATVIGIANLFNRSGFDVYDDHGLFLPVVSLKDVAAKQYQQDDPAVVDDIEKGNIVWQPKQHWAQLEAAMAAHQRVPVA